MEPLLKTYRAAYLYAHRAHHRTAGVTFFSDHAFFGELYPAYESAFDALMERSIGLGIEVDDAAVAASACQGFISVLKDVDTLAFYRRLSHTETELQAQLKAAAETSSFGTQNLLQDLADHSEARQYKIKQRLV